MFAYMVAPFALLMLLALGGNGVAAAAKYLQLILFVNMWPLTAVMVNAYANVMAHLGYLVAPSTARTTPSRGWGSQGLRNIVHMVVASALYALIPVPHYS